MDDRVLDRAAELAKQYLAGLADRPVGPEVDLGALRDALGGPLPETGEDPTSVIERLCRDVEPGLIASAGPRFFGFVIGGSHPVAVAADWLTSAWDQNAGLSVIGHGAALDEE